MREFTHKLRASILLPVIKQFVKPEDVIIDIGADNGIVTKQLSDAGLKIIAVADIKNSLQHEFVFYKITDNKTKLSDKSFDVALLIDVLHHIPLEKQQKIINEAKRIAHKVIICETLPNWCAYLIDWLNSMKGMITPYAFRTDWSSIGKVIVAKTPWWYPLKHVVVTL